MLGRRKEPRRHLIQTLCVNRDMDDQPENNNAIANRILLGAAIIFIILPSILFLVEKAGLGFGFGFFNPKFFIGLAIVSVFAGDKIYLKIRHARK